MNLCQIGISYSKYSQRSFFSSAILRKWMMLNMPLEHLRELKTVVALITKKITDFSTNPFISGQLSKAAAFMVTPKMITNALKTQRLVVFKHSVFLTMYFFFSYTYFLVCPHLIIFFTYFHMCVYIGETITLQNS